MISFTMNKTDAALFVSDILRRSGSVWPLTTITFQGQSEVCCVSFATDTLSVDTAEELVLICSKLLPNTSIENTPVG